MNVFTAKRAPRVHKLVKPVLLDVHAFRYVCVNTEQRQCTLNAHGYSHNKQVTATVVHGLGSRETCIQPKDVNAHTHAYRGPFVYGVLLKGDLLTIYAS